ncbi:hypothetical protein B0H66DRAFT_211550 [Apodospora peruviana]|uniref:Uncharacterized protein n=1 Tax=Apodospora peruviana TaxID=516989 RepID=A0AAE0ICV8_9PEZI|nr:hypothetical protein B0H66DRAFT_211550 [Apodospora peruviana]
MADDFRTVLRHWRLLQSKVGRHLDVLIQLRVLDQQDLAVAQSKIATSQQEIAVNEAKTLRFQSRSVFIFTAITIVFLPLSFFTSYFSMDVASTLSSPYESEMFWKICGPISGTIIVGVFAVARYVSRPVKDDPDEEEMVGGDLKIEPRQRGWLGLSSHLKNRLKMKLS